MRQVVRLRSPWAAIALGVTAGAAVGVVAWQASRRLAERRRAHLAEVSLEGLEDRVAQALAQDAALGSRPVHVSALAPGIIELTGAVADEAEAKLAVSIAQAAAGVRVVLNRLHDQATEAQLSSTRRRFADGAPELHETHWYGGGVGMGRRRHNPATDPDRPSDRADMIARDLGADRALELSSEPLDKIPPGTAGHSTGPTSPADRGVVVREDGEARGPVS